MIGIKSFEENKFYISSGNGENWSDYDGPFDTAKEAVGHMAQLCGKWASPEMIQSSVLVIFKDGILNLAKDDNGDIVNGQTIYWKNSVWYNGEFIFGDPIK